MEAIIIAELKLIQAGIAKLIEKLEGGDHGEATQAAEPASPAAEPTKDEAPNA